MIVESGETKGDAINLVAVEIYKDTLHREMIGAVYLEEKRLHENVDMIGKAICKARRLNVVE